MILVDTNVLVALADDRDRLHARATRDLSKLTGPFGVMSPVLTEACFLLDQPYLRARLAMLLERLPTVAIEPVAPWWNDIFQWLDHYAEHTPDLCDAVLVAQSSRTGASIWTYDTEFKTVWRKPDGKKLPVVGSTR